jgi:outer membrane protein
MMKELRERMLIDLNVQETHKRMDVTRDRYAAGLTTHTEVLDAETMRVNSESNHANAQFDAVMAGLRLKRATGEL